MSAAHEVDADAAPQLMNVVQEMAIAANVPMPRVYVIDDTAPNAFATGRDPQHASVAITTGLLQKLDREELQGVLGHELSHVRNFDIRFALVVAVLVGAIALLADFFLRFTFWGGVSGRSRDRDSERGRRQADHRRRRHRARPSWRRSSAGSSSWPSAASGSTWPTPRRVELTRNPYGLERALAKIGADQEVLEVANRATQHLYFANPIKKFEARSSGLMSTHPPILDRINRLRQLTGEAPLDPQIASSRPGLGAGPRLTPARVVVSSVPPRQPQAGWPSRRDSSVGRARD